MAFKSAPPPPPVPSRAPLLSGCVVRRWLTLRSGATRCWAGISGGPQSPAGSWLGYLKYIHSLDYIVYEVYISRHISACFRLGLKRLLLTVTKRRELLGEPHHVSKTFATAFIQKREERCSTVRLPPPWTVSPTACMIVAILVEVGTRGEWQQVTTQWMLP